MAIITLNNNSLSSVTALPAGVGGKVLQVVSASSTNVVSTSTTTMVEYMNTSITPSSTSSKIYAHFTGLGYANGTNTAFDLRLIRGSISGGSVIGTVIGRTYSYDGGNSWETVNLTTSILDTPSTTSSQQYTIGFSPDNNNFCNCGKSGNPSTLTLMEIAG